jgi:lysyl-tRNA synthetase class 1
VGEGLTVDSWMTYAPIESLLYYLFQNPKKQRRLYFDVIPKSVDDYLDELRRFPTLDEPAALDTVVWHLKKIGRLAPAYTGRIDFSLALNLISALGAGDQGLLFDYLRRYDPEVEHNPEIVSKLVQRAARYFQDFIEPHKQYRPATAEEKRWFADLRGRLAAYAGTDENELQAMVFDVATAAGADARQVFKAIYEVLLGQERGPRFGTFAKLVGRERVGQLLDRALSP